MNLTIITKRQAEIAQMIANGMTAKEVAFNIGISHQGVKNHLRSMKARMRTSTTVNTITELMRKGVIE